MSDKKTAVSAAETEQQADPTAPLEYRLKKPMMAYGKEVSVLTFKRPTGADLLRIGNPVIFAPHADPPRIEHDYAKVIAMTAKLAAVPSSSLEQLDPDDIIGLAWAISPFFMPA